MPSTVEIDEKFGKLHADLTDIKIKADQLIKELEKLWAEVREAEKEGGDSNE